MSKHFKHKHFYRHGDDNFRQEKSERKLSFLSFFLKRKLLTFLSLVCVVVFILGIINIKTVIVKAKSVVLAIDIYRKHNVKISPRYVENISSYEIKDVDVCDLKLCTWEKEDCTEWVGACSPKNPHLQYIQGNKAPYLHRIEICPSRSTERFDKLIKSMNEKGYDPVKNIIRIWPDYTIHNGQHRASWVAWKHGKGFKMKVLIVHYPDEETREKHNMDKIGEQSIQAQRRSKK